MKKIFIIICCIVGAIAVGGGIILFSPKTPAKIANESIVFSYSETQNFYSNKKYVDTNTTDYNNYTLTITNTAGVNFENPEIISSTNVDKTIQVEENQIVVDFKITFGAEFTFTLTTDNFEEMTDTKTATEYIQKDNIQLKVATLRNGEYSIFNSNTLYIVDDDQKIQAYQDGYYYEYYIKVDYPSVTSSNFEISVAESGQLIYDNTTSKLAIKESAVSGKGSKVYVNALDGSGAKREYTFNVEYVSATSVSNLPESISLDVSNNPTTTLQPSVLPTYAKNYTITFETSDNSVFTVNNYTLSAVAKGNANLIVKLNSTQVATIPVSVTETANPNFEISLQQNIKNALGEKVEFSNNICTLHTASIVESYQTLVFDIAFENMGVNSTDVNYTITSDTNSIIIDGSGEDGFGIGSTTSLPFTIFVDTTQTGSVTIKFSATTQTKSYEQTLTIILTNT